MQASLETSSCREVSPKKKASVCIRNHNWKFHIPNFIASQLESSHFEWWIAKEANCIIWESSRTDSYQFSLISWCLAWSMERWTSSHRHTSSSFPQLSTLPHGWGLAFDLRLLSPSHAPTYQMSVPEKGDPWEIQLLPPQKKRCTKGVQFRFVWSCRNLYEETGIMWPYAIFVGFSAR